MMAGHFDRPSAARGYLETGFDATVDPLAHIARLHRAVGGEAEDRGHPTADSLLNRQTLPRFWVIDDAVVADALSHRRPTRDDDQVRVLEPARHPVQVVES